MNINEIARKIRDELSPKTIANCFGLDNICTLIIIRRYRIDGKPQQDLYEIKNVYINYNSPSTSNAITGIEVANNEFKLEGISKELRLDEICSTGVSYWLNAELKDGIAIGGIELEFVDLINDNPLCWSLSVRRKPDDRRFE